MTAGRVLVCQQPGRRAHARNAAPALPPSTGEPLDTRIAELRAVAKQQLIVFDLRPADAPALLAAQLGGPDATTPVVWRDAESELLVHPGRTRVRFAPGFVLVELTAECDQAGPAPLVFAYKVGGSPNEASLSAVSEPAPRGDPVLAARWAEPVTTLVWHAVLRTGQALLARRRAKTPLTLGGVYTLGRVLSFIATVPVTAGELRDYYASVRQGETVLDLSVLNRRFLGSVPLRRSKR